MEIATTILRTMLGGIMILVPLNAFFNKSFKPPMPMPAQLVMDTFRNTGYLLFLIQATELVVGILLVANFFTPLALLALIPISLNILLFHLFLAPPVGPGLFIFALNAFLLWAYRADYFLLLQP